MTQHINQRYIKFFYFSDFSISLALGMIPLMTVLSYFISSSSTTTFAYALLLALYNISTTLPKMYVAKNLSGKKNTFNSIIKFKFIQISIWLLISLVFFFIDSATLKTSFFCILYLMYALVKGSIDILSIDVYSRVIPSRKLGKFFGYKHSLNSLAEFIGAMMLVSIFEFLQIDLNYGIIFFIVFMLDLFSLTMLCLLRGKIKLVDGVSYSVSSKSEIIISNASDSVEKTYTGLIKKTAVEIYNILKNDKLLSSFLLSNVISIVGASVASFFIPFGTEKLQLEMAAISVANAVWLVSKVLASIFWGYIVDLVGSKYAMIGSRVSLVLSYMIALNLNSIYGFYVILILHGISSSALVVMAQNIFIEIGGDNGALYSAVNSIVSMPFFVVMPIVASLISSKFGYEASFMVSIAPLLISLILMKRVKIAKID